VLLAADDGEPQANLFLVRGRTRDVLGKGDIDVACAQLVAMGHLADVQVLLCRTSKLITGLVIFRTSPESCRA
jgi:hypothetical protein